MKKSLFLLLLALLAMPLTGQPLSRKEFFAEIVNQSKVFQRIKSLDKGLSSRDLFSYAFFVCESETNLDQLDDVFKHAARMQDRDKTSAGYGNYRWTWRDGLVMDFNAVEFCMETGSLIWILHRDKLTESQTALFKELLDYSVEGCLRHKVSPAYTNISIMNAQNLVLLGETLSRPEVLEEGLKRLRAFALQTALFGICEYNSPTYTGVDIGCLQVFNHFTVTPEAKQITDKLLKLFWSELVANSLPSAKRCVGSHSRDYDYLSGRGAVDAYLYAAKIYEEDNPNRRIPYTMLISDWRPTEDILSLATTTPRTVNYTWGADSSQYSSLWVGNDIALGIAGACYHNMDIPLAVNFKGENPMLPRAYFIADGRRDPYGKKVINEGTGPHQKTLHLKPFWGGTQVAKDALGLVVYRPFDFSTATNPTLESHIVLPLEGDEIFIDDTQVEFTPAAPMAIPLTTKSCVFVRFGKTVAAFNVPMATSIKGDNAQIALVWDNNVFKVARITVAHHDLWGNPPPKASFPAAAFHVRVTDTEGIDAERFAKWRHEFMAAQRTANVVPDNSIDITVQSESTPLRLETKRPFNVLSTCQPEQPREIFAVNGRDIGTEIMGDTPGIKEYFEELAKQEKAISKNTIVVMPGQTARWEAEAGAVVSNMTIGEDDLASGGKFVWTPGEVGGKGGGNGLVTWQFDIKNGGSYFLWGCFSAPTPEDDSFLLHVFTDKQNNPLLHEAWHVGTTDGSSFQWRQYKDPIELPKGLVRIQLQTREDGTKVDQLFMTQNSNDTP